MKTSTGVTAALFTASILCLSGCGQVSLVGSGTIITDTPSIEDFTGVDASHTFKVTIVAGAEFKVIVRADDNVMPHVEVMKESDILKLDLKESNYNLKNVTLEAEVTMPGLQSLRLSGATTTSISGFESSEEFHARISGSSKLSGDLKSGDTKFDLSGASSATITGSGAALKVDASGASSVVLSEFAVVDGEVDASGSSSVAVNASGTLDASASGASKVVYSGTPTVGRADTSGATSIHAK